MRRADWESLLDCTPADAELRLAYATWLRDEADEPVAAACQEWMAQRGKWPIHTLYNHTGLGPGGWHWCDWMVMGSAFHMLPKNVTLFLMVAEVEGWYRYPSRQAAEADLCRALVEAGVMGTPAEA